MALAAGLGVAALLASPVSNATPPGAGDGGPRRGGDHEQRERLRQEVIDQMRIVRMWKMTEELKLDEATAAKLFPLLAKFDDQARDIGREHHETMRSLWKETSAERPDELRLRGMVEKLNALRAKRNQLEEERWQALRQVLTTLQQAKLMLLLPRLEDGFRRRIREAWEEQRRGPDGGGPRPPGPRPPFDPAK
jgi:Spy/CpxP family protein refolding chaperone